MPRVLLREAIDQSEDFAVFEGAAGLVIEGRWLSMGSRLIARLAEEGAWETVTQPDAGSENGYRRIDVQHRRDTLRPAP